MVDVTNVVFAEKHQLSKPIGSLPGLATGYNCAPVAATVSTTTSTAAKNVLPSGPAVSVSSSAQLVSLLGNAAPGSGGTINVTPGTVNVGGNVAGAVSASAGGGRVNANANGS